MNRLLSIALNKTRRVISQSEEHAIVDLARTTKDTQMIKDLINTDKPSLIGRFGSGELNAVATYIRKKARSNWPGEKCYKFIKGELDTFWWHDGIRSSLYNGAGMFSVDDKDLDKFALRMIDDARYIDILGSWRKEEALMEEEMKNCKKVSLISLEPYLSNDPWSECLTEKDILVIHPYFKTIKKQYKIRENLFRDNRVLPDFRIQTFKPLQTIAGNTDKRFTSWFDGLNWMEDKINDLQFDIAIIGAGAYGLPLAAHIKRIGRKAIHLGGATQILFGIKGARWENKPEFQMLFNKHWVRPDQSEKPQGYQYIEKGCYW